jgi:hypothetical protein
MSPVAINSAGFDLTAALPNFVFHTFGTLGTHLLPIKALCHMNVGQHHDPYGSQIVRAA